MEFSEFLNYSIYSLRNIARSIGVKCPTALKRNELISEILLIAAGKKPPHYTRRGRPLSEKGNTFNLNITGIENFDESVLELKRLHIYDESIRYKNFLLDALNDLEKFIDNISETVVCNDEIKNKKGKP